jgi:hypothetical protein
VWRSRMRLPCSLSESRWMVGLGRSFR